MIIPIRQFSGEFPRVLPHQLPDGAAQYTQSLDIARGNLSGLADDLPAPIGPAASTVRSLFMPESNAYLGVTFAWYAWDREVDAVRGPTVDDQYTRFYWSDGTGFYVSQAKLGGYGREPNAATNRWKVGVPQPATPMAQVNTGFQIPGITDYSFSAFCEGTDGARLNKTAALIHNYDSNAVLPSMVSRRWMLYPEGLDCMSNAAASSGSSTSTTTTEQATLENMAFYGVAPIVPGGGGSIGAAQATVSVPIYKASGSDTFYFHWADWESAPLAGSASWTDDVTIRTFSHIGSGWYSTNSSATAPNTGGASAVASVTYTPALEVTMTRDDGSTVVAVLRTDAAANSWPAELSGYSASLSIKEQARVQPTDPITYYMEVELHSRTDYLTSRAYSYSYVNVWGEEGALADPLLIEDIIEGQQVKLSYTPPPAGHGYCPIQKVRIYRTATGSGGTDYLFVADVDPINTSEPYFLDTLTGDQLGESAQTVDFLPPPQNLKGLAMLPNGILAGFVANEIYLMEPYLPYACVRKNIKTLPYNIVSLLAGETGLYAVTSAHPYLLSGVTPDSIVPQKIAAIQGGVSRKSICDAGQVAIYASRDGLVMLRGLDASLDGSFKLFTREKWLEFVGGEANLQHLHLCAHDGAVLGWFDNGYAGFLVRLDEAQGLTRIPNSGITASLVSPEDDALYLAKGTSIAVFRKGTTRRQWQWWSKDYIVPKPTNFGALQVVGDGPVSIQVAADGQIIHTIPTQDMTPEVNGKRQDQMIFRLPPGFKARRWMALAIGEAGYSEVREIYLAETVQELRNV